MLQVQSSLIDPKLYIVDRVHDTVSDLRSGGLGRPTRLAVDSYIQRCNGPFFQYSGGQK